MEDIQNNNSTQGSSIQTKKNLTLQKHNSRSKVFFIIFEIIVILTFISGILLGWGFGQSTISEEISSPSYGDIQKSFNWILMLSIWVGGVVLDLFIYAIQSHLENQEKLIDNQIVIAKLISKNK